MTKLTNKQILDKINAEAAAYDAAEREVLRTQSKTKIAETVEDIGSRPFMHARFEQLYADYMTASDALVAEFSEVGIVRCVTGLIASICAGIGAYSAGIAATEMILLATVGAATGFLPTMIAVIGTVISMIAAFMATRYVCKLACGEYDDVIVAKVSAAKSWALGLFDRKAITLASK